MRLSVNVKQVLINLSFQKTAQAEGKTHYGKTVVPVSAETIKKIKTPDECDAFGAWMYKTYFSKINEEKFFAQQSLPGVGEGDA